MDTLSATDLLPAVESITSWDLSPSTRVLLTGVGCPGAANVIASLQEYGYTVIGTDLNPESYGRFHCDRFYQSPPGDHPNFGNVMLELVSREEVDVVFPMITAEQMAWAKIRWVLDSMEAPVLVADCSAIETCLDKSRTYKLAGELSVPTVPWFLSTGGAVRKPVRGKGSRGVEHLDYDEASIFMDNIKGEEYAVNALCKNGEILTCCTRVRTRLKGGLHYTHEVISAPHLIDYAKSIIQHLNYDWFINVQFKGEYLMEVNPRISTTVTWGEFNLPNLGIQLALGNLTPDQVKKVESPPIGLKSFYHHAQITYQEDQWPVEEL